MTERRCRSVYRQVLHAHMVLASKDGTNIQSTRTTFVKDQQVSRRVRPLLELKTTNTDLFDAVHDRRLYLHAPDD